MPWENVGNFLSRFANLKAPKAFMQEETAKAVKNVVGADIVPDEIEWRAGIVYIKIKNQILKNEIFLKKEKILEILKQRLGPKAPIDIRF